MPPISLRDFRVTKNAPLAKGIFALTLEPADGEPVFAFQAGQWVYLHLLNGDGTLWAKTAFSIASAPAESSKTIELAIKVYGDYTKRAQTLTPGDAVKIHGPFGVFTLRPGTAPLAMFAGGIGVTPLRSMIRELAATHDPRPTILLYSNPKHDAAAYAEEFRELAKAHPAFHPIFAYTREQGVPGGECRRIDATMMEAHIPDMASAEYFMCGPRPFMDAIRECLEARGVDVKTKLHKELFF